MGKIPKRKKRKKPELSAITNITKKDFERHIVSEGISYFRHAKTKAKKTEKELEKSADPKDRRLKMTLLREQYYYMLQMKEWSKLQSKKYPSTSKVGLLLPEEAEAKIRQRIKELDALILDTKLAELDAELRKVSSAEALKSLREKMRIWGKKKILMESIIRLAEKNPNVKQVLGKRTAAIANEYFKKIIQGMESEAAEKIDIAKNLIKDLENSSLLGNFYRKQRAEYAKMRKVFGQKFEWNSFSYDLGEKIKMSRKPSAQLIQLRNKVEEIVRMQSESKRIHRKIYHNTIRKEKLTN